MRSLHTGTHKSLSSEKCGLTDPIPMHSEPVHTWSEHILNPLQLFEVGFPTYFINIQAILTSHTYTLRNLYYVLLIWI